MVGQQRKLDFYFQKLRSTTQNKPRVNYLKMNQGYDENDMQEEDSNFSCDRIQRKSKKIKKHSQFKTHKSKDKVGLKDNLEILLSWKRDIKFKPNETNKNNVHVVKQLCSVDLSKFGTSIQGIFININWANESGANGITSEEFRKLELPKKLINNGIVFIWSDKRLLNDIIEIMDEKGFQYIENHVTVNLNVDVAYTELKKVKPYIVNTNKQEAVLQNLQVLQDRIQVKDMLDKRPYKYLNNAKRTLLMFRKFDKSQLELRHQRTSDVLFDLVDSDGSLSAATKEYIYQLIETLLPKALNYKLMELWGDASTPRQGWITVTEQKKK